ncbi:MAG: HupE/UreJ family protein [Pseudomonadota bacterium]
MTKVSNAMKTAAASGVAVVAAAVPAFAHHPMGGELPSTFISGLLSGIGHPVIGFDHLAFIIAVGLASAFMANRFIMPAIFVAATMVGCVLYSVGGIQLPMTEFAIAASVLVIGGLVMSGREIAPAVFGMLFAVAGLFHGSAYAGEILGAEATPLAAYLMGFSLVQYAIAAVAIVVVREVWNATSSIAMQPRLAGAVVAGVGATFLIENMESVLFAAV